MNYWFLNFHTKTFFYLGGKSIGLGVDGEKQKQNEQRQSTIASPTACRLRSSFHFSFENNETRDLDNQKLQRLVLLKQLEVLKLKKEKLTETNNQSGPDFEVVDVNETAETSADNSEKTEPVN